ncbi:uncharacterized protein LOC105432248 isoform X2 [Pogonomyrmex barbatus]|uniref:Uncharacterized protein LOC105432248 isoform X2 n=1 Tax=Pogonomyrmex barbatus TaxID=144034 RepID=A0A6I9WNW4_9HYME|nr:uncharacterized protein LOC105432248 isoform X2 [Pogonomyrmex barbatus]
MVNAIADSSPKYDLVGMQQNSQHTEHDLFIKRSNRNASQSRTCLTQFKSCKSPQAHNGKFPEKNYGRGGK